MRASGILLPISSLPSKYGIGCFSKEAYNFVDGLKKAHQHFWQILPLGPTSYGDSPYQSFSTFAGNPYFIDLEKLVNEGLLMQGELDECNFGEDERYIDYEKIYFERYDVLRNAYERFDFENNGEYRTFLEENEFWLDDYALYMAVKDYFEDVAWTEWDEDIRLREPEAMEHYTEMLETDIEFYKFLQFEFNKQWLELKAYANENEVQIIGDIPIYVAFDSADCWANTELFQFDDENVPLAVAGCPPDSFAADGQLWGNLLYKWEYHEETGYKWWISRVRNSIKWYDVVRIDHFRGFDEYYSIPFGDKTAVNGHWVKGPGINLFNALKKELGEVNIIAEDLGYLTDSVVKLVKDIGFPGMKIIQFAFDSRETSNYYPHTYTPNSVVYTGTHDNDNIQGWYDSISDEDKENAIEYMHNYNTERADIHWDFIKVALASVSKLAIIPMQDYLGLGSKCRMNIPSTLGGNWTWRVLEEEITDNLLDRIAYLTDMFGRWQEVNDQY